MNAIENLLLFVFLVICILLLALIKSDYDLTGITDKIKKADRAPWDLQEFLRLHPSRGKQNEYYRFTEENVRSHAYRFVGRFDTAIFHWEEAVILDVIVERKFPVNCLPNRAREEDIFQAGLYTLALSESGISCSEAKLVTIYCLQDTAKRCSANIHLSKCWTCSDAKKFVRRYNDKDVRQHLKRLDEVWYLKRRPKAAPSISNCRPCPYGSEGTCNYSAV